MKSLICLIGLWVLAVNCALAEDVKAEITEQSSDINQASAFSYLYKMQTAYTQLNYKMLYINTAQQPIEPMWLESGNKQDKRIIYRSFLNGPVRETLQSRGKVDYYEQGHYLYSLPSQREQSAFANIAHFDLKKGQQHYQYIVLGKGRIAERQAITIKMQSMDQYRYSYLVWLDAITYLPLRVDMVTKDNDILAQTLVLSVVVNEQIKDELIELAKQQADSLSVEQKQLETDTAHWHIGWLPEGFKLVKGDRHKLILHDTDPISYMMLSDGLVSVSVYISSKPTINEDQRSIIQRQGTLLYTMQQGIIEITIIGEIPLQTAEKIAASIQAVE